MGGNGTWELMRRYPGKVSAAVPVAGVGLTYATEGDGKEIVMGMTEDMLVTPICIVYDNDDIYSDGDYNRRVYNTLLENGAKYVTYRETSGVGHLICDSFINSEDISILDWLYAQERDVG
jgi:predicted peptidase